jgi:hypothetical protein
MGTGSGEFGNPMITDIIGTAAGHVHTSALNVMNTMSDKVMSSIEGININSAITTLTNAVNSSFDPGSDPAVLAAKNALDNAVSALNNTGNLDLQNVLSTGVTKFQNSVSQIAKEVSNMSLASIDLNISPSSSINGLLGMATKLQGFGVDKMNLGFSTMFENMSTNNVYGDAIKAALAEGKNIANLAKYGIRLTNNIG